MPPHILLYNISINLGLSKGANTVLRKGQLDSVSHEYLFSEYSGKGGGRQINFKATKCKTVFLLFYIRILSPSS